MEGTVEERARQARAEWKRHKFQSVEYPYRYLLPKLLRKYDIELSDYYKAIMSEEG